MLGGMHDKELYSRILEIKSPWEVTEVDLRRQEGEVLVRVEWKPSNSFICPKSA